VSGDSAVNSEHQKNWHSALRVDIEPCPRAGDYGPKSAISIRPKEQLNRNISVGSAAFCFLLVMAFVVFGELPARQGSVERV
jgi:hypothetical protein